MFRNRVARTPRAKLENCGDACSRVRPRLLKDRDPLIGVKAWSKVKAASLILEDDAETACVLQRVLPLRLGLSGPAFPHHHARLAAGWLGNLSAYSRATRVSKLITAKTFEPHWFQIV